MFDALFVLNCHKSLKKKNTVCVIFPIELSKWWKLLQYKFFILSLENQLLVGDRV